MTSLDVLATMEHEDPEYIPQILPERARIAIRGPVRVLSELLSRAAAVTPVKELIAGTAYAMLSADLPEAGSLPKVSIAATDGEQTVRVVIDGVQVGRAGRILLPPKRVADILKLAPSETVSLEAEDTTLLIRSGRALWHIQLPAGDTLAALLPTEPVQWTSVPVPGFLRALAVAYRATTKNDTRPGLMQAEVRNGHITSCNGPQVHRQTIPGMPTDIEPFGIPLRTMEELVRALVKADEADSVEFAVTDRFVLFRLRQDWICARRMLVPFPSMDALLLAPALSNDLSLTVDRAALLDVIKRVRINADQDYSSIGLTIVPRAKIDSETVFELTVSARDRIGNGSMETLPCVFSGKTGRTLTFNHRYLTDLLDCYRGEQVVLRLGHDSKTVKTPLLLEDQGAGFAGVVQQMRGS